jgi:hypothetical protein
MKSLRFFYCVHDCRVASTRFVMGATPVNDERMGSLHVILFSSCLLVSAKRGHALKNSFG